METTILCKQKSSGSGLESQISWIHLLALSRQSQNIQVSHTDCQTQPTHIWSVDCECFAHRTQCRKEKVVVAIGSMNCVESNASSTS